MNRGDFIKFKYIIFMTQKKILVVSEIKHWRLLSSWLFSSFRKGEIELFNHEDKKTRLLF